MSDLVGISSGAVQAYQRALGVVSNNIANVGTEGYTRQVSDLAATAPRRIGQAFLGTGVEFQAVRRSVDEFVQQNMRDSNSDLATQKPLVDYANRVVDIMGSEDSGLATALDQFFASARELSADPSSSILRGAFLRDAEGLASRFNEVAGQLEAVKAETKDYMDTASAELNTLASQLAAVNGQLSKRNSVEVQPATLLDERDLLLQKLSAFARIKPTFAANGEVSVSLANSLAKGMLVEGQDARTLAIVGDAANGTRYEALLDPYGDKEVVSGLSSGEIGGLLAFTEQVLGPAESQLNHLAQVLAQEVNQIHQNALDGYGNQGGVMFAFDAGEVEGAASIGVALDDPRKIATAAMFRASESPSNPSRVRVDWSFEEPLRNDLTPSLLSTAFENNPDLAYSVSVDAGKNLSAVATVAHGSEDVVVYFDDAQQGQQLQVITADGTHLLGAELTLDQQAELAIAQPALIDRDAIYTTTYLNQSGAQAYKQLDMFIGAKASPITTEQFSPQGASLGDQTAAAVLQGKAIAAAQTGTVVAAGQFKFNHVVMEALTTTVGGELQASDVATWLSRAVVRPLGSAQGSLVVASSDIDLTQELNLTGYQGVTAGIQPPTGGHANLNALVAAINEYSGITRIDASVDVNGDLSLDMQAGYTASTVQAVANAAGVPGVTVSAQTDIVIAADDLDLSKSLSLYGRSAGVGNQLDLSPPAGTWSSAKELALAIESNANQTGVTAYVTLEGSLVVTNVDGVAGEDIYIGPNTVGGLPNNALGVSAGWQKGAIAITRDVDSMIEGVEDVADIRLGMGEGGSPWLLQQLGLRVGAHIGEQAAADLKVLVTGEGTASVSATYGASEADVKSLLRAQPFEVQFTAIDTYQVVDVNTGTVMAQRRFDPHALPPTLAYMGMSLTFTSPPMQGDRFMVDGNHDGVGDNRALLTLVELQDKAVMPGEMTLTDAYINQVSQIGNISRQAKVAQEALQVVYEQAIETREQVSGVSLDEEAADLIRFQQAYQASAKVMQTASTLFDAILTVR